MPLALLIPSIVGGLCVAGALYLSGLVRPWRIAMVYGVLSTVGITALVWGWPW